MTENVIASVTAVFDAMADWFISIIPTITGIFYSAENGMTLLGVLALCGLSLSIVFLVLGLITNFFQFRA